MIDVHEYQIFSNGEVAMSWDQHIATACSKRSQYSSFHLWTVVGEWSTAFTDCAAKNPNATSIGSRYDGSYPGSSRIGDCTPWTGNGNAFSSDYKIFLRKFWEAQVTGEHCLLILSRGQRFIQTWQRGRREMAGSTGRGSSRTRTNGATKPVSILGGFHGILANASIRTFAVRSIQRARQPSC